MTDQQRIAEITTRCEAATPGPWKEAISISKEAFGIFSNNMLVCTSENMEDNTFIAHAREDIPWAVDTIKALEAELAAKDAEIERLRDRQRWIPVSERLPDKDVLVLLFLESGNQTKITTGKIYSSDNPKLDGEFCIGFDTLSPDFLHKETITHWMPLPAAPKGE